MLVFGLIFAAGAAALLLVQRLDIECSKSHPERKQPARSPAAVRAQGLPTYSA
jgi:hypothetical protein